MCQRLVFLLALLLQGVAQTAPVSPVSLFAEAKRILFLGDSITNDGRYISYIEAHLRSLGHQPPEMINLGLPSETCSGLSEPDHPFPRPDVHERLHRALDKVSPDLVVACYGMNDGIYYPFSKDRFAGYQRGLSQLIDKVHASGAKLILLTPPPFDPLPMGKQGKLLPDGAEKYAWFAIYEKYDQVIKRYADHVLTLFEPVEMVIDINSPILDYTLERRKSDPDFAMSNDGVHIDDTGHRIMADTILRALGYKPNLGKLNPAFVKAIHTKTSVLHSSWLTHVGHKRPGVKSGKRLGDAKAAAEEIMSALPAVFGGAQEGSANETPVKLISNTLDNWEGDLKYWKLEDGIITGSNTTPIASSTYLFTKEKFREFRLVFEVKQTMSPKHSTMHSAIAALGERITDKGDNPYGFKGPLLMFCHDWGIWDAHRRNRIEPANHRGTLNISGEKKGDWNLCEICVTGNRIQFAANGKLVFDFEDTPEMLQESQIGLQLHSNQRPQEFQFRKIMVSRNPSPGLITLEK